MPTFPKIAWLK